MHEINILQEIRRQKYKNFGYFMMPDLDFRHPFPIDAIIKTIKLLPTGLCFPQMELHLMNLIGIDTLTEEKSILWGPNY